MKVTILSHDLSSNAAMRAHRLAEAAGVFASVELIGPVEPAGVWPALPNESWIRSVAKTRFPQFMESFLELIDAADGDVLIAVKPHLASLGVGLLAAERRGVPLVLDIDDLETALAPPSAWKDNPAMTDLSRPGSAIYVSLLTKCLGAVSAITVASTALQRRFGGVVLPHGCDTTRFDPAAVDRDRARSAFGFNGPIVLFPGAARMHKGLHALAVAIQQIPEARLVVTCRPDDLADEDWNGLPITRIPFVPYTSLPMLLAAADVIAVPQLDSEAASYQTPMKIFEAMAMAKPIVTTTVGDLPAIVRGCAKLISPGDSDELAAAITWLLRHPGQAAVLGRRARVRCVRRFSLLKTSQRLARVIGHLNGGDRRSECPVEQGHSQRSSRRRAVQVDVPGGIFSDLTLPSLSRALSPIEFQCEFERNFPDVMETPAEVNSIRVLRYKPGRRCVIEYRLQPPQEHGTPGALIGKVSARASTRKFHTQKAFWNAGFQDSSEDALSVPEPVGLISNWQLWLQRKVAGQLVSALCEGQGALVLASRVADALVKLHRSGVATSRAHTVTDEIRILKHSISKVMARNPHLRGRLEQILVRSHDLAAVIPQSPYTGIHRDFYADQVIVSENDQRLYLLDFDLYSLGDPALDAGNFLGHLTEQSLRRWGHPDGLTECEHAFREQFLRRSRHIKDEAVQAYAVLTLVRHIFLGSQFRDRLHYADALMDLCERRLECSLRMCRSSRHSPAELVSSDAPRSGSA